MPFIIYKNKKYLTRWPKSWNSAILKVAHKYLNEAASDTYCNIPYKCKDLKFSICYYCYVGKVEKDGENIIRHKSCEFKRSKISWTIARKEGKLDVIPSKYTIKDISLRYRDIKQSQSFKSLKKRNEYKIEYTHNNYKRCKKDAKASIKRRSQLFKTLPEKIIKTNKYPKGSKREPLPNTPINIKKREYAIKYKKKNYKKAVTLQYKRNKLKTAISRQFLEELLLSKNT